MEPDDAGVIKAFERNVLNLAQYFV